MANIMETQQRLDQRQELGMRGAGTPLRYGLQSPEPPPQAQVQRTMNQIQLAEMTKLTRIAVVKCMCRDVVALRRKSEGSKSLLVDEEHVLLMDMLKSSSSSATTFINLVIDTCVPAKEFKEVIFAVCFVMTKFLCLLFFCSI